MFLTLKRIIGAKPYGWAPEVHIILLISQLLQERIEKILNIIHPNNIQRGPKFLVSNDPRWPFKSQWSTNPLPLKIWDEPGWHICRVGKNSYPVYGFCHEWAQIIDGTMNWIQLENDFIRGSRENQKTCFFFKKPSRWPMGRKSLTEAETRIWMFMAMLTSRAHYKDCLFMTSAKRPLVPAASPRFPIQVFDDIVSAKQLLFCFQLHYAALTLISFAIVFLSRRLMSLKNIIMKPVD